MAGMRQHGGAALFITYSPQPGETVEQLIERLPGETVEQLIEFLLDETVEQLLQPLLDGRRPVVLFGWGGFLPQVREAAPDAPDLDEAAADFYRGFGWQRAPRPGPGKPARNAYQAAVIAYMSDIEERPLIGTGDPPRRTLALDDASGGTHQFGRHEYLGEQIALRHGAGALVDPDDARGAVTCQTVDRWRDHGRRVLAKLGAWPWAVVPDGKLARSWRRDPRFAAALADWHVS